MDAGNIGAGAELPDQHDLVARGIVGQHRSRLTALEGAGYARARALNLVALPVLPTLLLAAFALVVLGFGFALFSSPNTNAIMSSVDKKLYGVASGAMGTTRLMGQMLSMGISMSIISMFIGPVQITPAHAAGLVQATHSAFVAFGALCFGSIFASLARGEKSTVAKIGLRGSLAFSCATQLQKRSATALQSNCIG